jgi:ATP-dependent RNA helicase DeaD
MVMKMLRLHSRMHHRANWPAKTNGAANLAIRVAADQAVATVVNAKAGRAKAAVTVTGERSERSGGDRDRGSRGSPGEGKGGGEGKARPTLGAKFGGESPFGGAKTGDKRPFKKKDGPPSKHGVKHKAKGNRPR